MKNIIKTKFKGLLIFEGEVHKDNRGYLREVLVEKNIKKNLNFKLYLNQKKMLLEDFIFSLKNLKASIFLY